MRQFFDTLPPVRTMVLANSDTELVDMIGPNPFEILRQILLSNRVHLIHLPDELKIKDCAADTIQFLSIMATPEKELDFQRQKVKSGSRWLWHGSYTSRWHSILHTGLQDLGRTKDATHGGPWFGDGVYMSNQSDVSYSYAQSGDANRYRNSQLPKNMVIMALVENIPGPKLNLVAPAEYTQQNNSGLIVRCLMVVRQLFRWDPYATPPKHVPDLEECLEYYGKQGLML